MADIYMHSRLSEAVINKLKYDFDEKIVYLGAQGPDPLYYVISGKDAKEYRYYADRMHDTNTRMLLSNLVKYVKSNLTKETYSFLTGFICHYALDVKIHPYVYYNVGIYNKEKPETHQYRGLHLKFERAMDATLIEDTQNMKPNKFKLTKKYFPLKEAPEDVSKMMGHALKQTFGKDDGDIMYDKGAKKMYFNVKNFVTDRTGIKKLLYKIIDSFNKQTDLFYQDLSFFGHKDTYDYLNKQKNEWHHPITNEEYNYSVIDLYDQAEQFALSIMAKVSAHILEDKSIDLDTVFTNLSFNSGIACDHHDKMKYFNNYQKKTIK